VGKFYVTTPIYYVNDEPHIGHTYTTILADVLSRYHRLFGDEVFFSTGTDEHGLKVQEAAKKRGISAKQQCDEMVERFIALWEKLDISYTRFIRTTEKRHKFVVQSLLTYLYERGDIYFDIYIGKYCVPDERFWTEKDLVNGKCPDCGREVITIEEKNYFFKMSKYRDWLVDYIKGHPDSIKPETRKNEILGFLKNPLADLCISRPKSRLNWGIEIPFDKKYVTYVWFDALINYISTIGVYRNNNSFQKWWPCDLHLVGKDIITTHAVYWPIMLKSAGFELPKTILAHGWWLVQDTKMSKSLSNVVKPIDLIDKYGYESFRYVMIKNMSLGSDANFSEEMLIKTINSDLANNYGNLLSRITNMIQKYFDGKIPKPNDYSDYDEKIIYNVKSLLPEVKKYIGKIEVNNALSAILSFIREINRYIDEKAPWKLYKDGDIKTLKTVIYTASESFRIATVYLAPIIVDKAVSALKVFGEDFNLNEVNENQEIFSWGRLKPGFAIEKNESLFPRISLKEDGEKKNDKNKNEKDCDMIDIEYFNKIKMKVGKVLEAYPVKGSNKLYRLIVDIGNEKRQIVSGIAKHYKANDIIGKEIVIITNLKPTKLMGFESNGMLLTAEGKDELSILIPEKQVEPGSEIS